SQNDELIFGIDNPTKRSSGTRVSIRPGQAIGRINNEDSANRHKHAIAPGESPNALINIRRYPVSAITRHECGSLPSFTDKKLACIKNSGEDIGVVDLRPTPPICRRY